MYSNNLYKGAKYKSNFSHNFPLLFSKYAQYLMDFDEFAVLPFFFFFLIFLLLSCRYWENLTKKKNDLHRISRTKSIGEKKRSSRKVVYRKKTRHRKTNSFDRDRKMKWKVVGKSFSIDTYIHIYIGIVDFIIIINAELFRQNS